MSDYAKTEKILRSLASKSRLQILECIQHDVSNPGDISKELKRHRSTIEKHLRVLSAGGIVEEVPSLSKGGQLTIRYGIKENVKEALIKIREVAQKL
nr:helix-turn-helix domain-containing protein [Candidatus Njordarchaeum guaymaensis]